MRKVLHTEVQFGWQSYNGMLTNVIFFFSSGKGYTSQFVAGETLVATLLQLLLISSAHLEAQKGKIENRGFWTMNKDLSQKDKRENICASFGKYFEVPDKA